MFLIGIELLQLELGDEYKIDLISVVYCTKLNSALQSVIRVNCWVLKMSECNNASTKILQYSEL